MATLDELRAKWFLSFPGLDTAFPPVRRHAGRDASVYTHGRAPTPTATS